MRTLTPPTPIVLALAAALASGCGANTSPSALQLSAGNAPARGGLQAALKTPALIAYDIQSESLEYWPIRPGGGALLQPLSGALHIYGPRGLVANGNVVAIAGYGPPKVITYDVVTKAITSMNDPYGDPYDLAIDKHGTMYALNPNNVAVFKSGSSKPEKLSCPYINVAESIAVNNEGDVLVNGVGAGGVTEVVEYPAGSSKCAKLHLRPVRGYIAGIGVDPKTDDLIALDNPGRCNGGVEGRMLIYPKPYEARTAIKHILQGTLCAERFRLDASSTHIFVEDSNYLHYLYIDQDRYPSGKNEGTYTNSDYGSCDCTGFTTIPNRLPN